MEDVVPATCLHELRARGQYTRSDEVMAWTGVGNNMLHEPLTNPHDATYGSHYRLPSNQQPPLGQPPSLAHRNEKQDPVTLQAPRPWSAYERAPQLHAQEVAKALEAPHSPNKSRPNPNWNPVTEGIDGQSHTVPAPKVPHIAYPKGDPWGDEKRKQELLSNLEKKTPRKGWKPW